MPGPWFRPRDDLDFLPHWGITSGDLLEADVYDEGGHAQGCVLVQVQECSGPDAHGCFFMAKYVTASDGYYDHWMSEGGFLLSGWYHLCRDHAVRCRHRHGRDPVVHTDRVRQVFADDLGDGRPQWIGKRRGRQLARDLGLLPDVDGGQDAGVLPRLAAEAGPEAPIQGDLAGRLADLDAELGDRNPPARRNPAPQEEDRSKGRAANS